VESAAALCFQVHGYTFDYGSKLVHTVDVLSIDGHRKENARYPRGVERVGDPPPQYGHAGAVAQLIFSAI